MDSPNERRGKKEEEEGEKLNSGNVDREMCVPFLELWLWRLPRNEVAERNRHKC